MAGQATANQNITAAQARSTAVLNLPVGATITYARIYWAGMLPTMMTPDTGVRIERPGSLDQTVMADDSFSIARFPAASAATRSDWSEEAVRATMMTEER